MFLALKKFFGGLIGERWTDVSLSNKFGIYLVFSRSGEPKAIVLWHGPSYERSTVADTIGHMRICLRDSTWPQILEFSRSKGEAQSLPDYSYDRLRDRVLYSLDGETFSIPASAIEEIDRKIALLD